MAIETTRRGFMLLLGALAAAGAVTAEPYNPTKLQSMPGRFGYRVYKDGEAFFNWIEGDDIVGFEFEINMSTNVFAMEHRTHGSMRTMVMERPERYFHMWGKTFVVGPAKVVHDAELNVVWLEFHDAVPFDPETDRLIWAVGQLEPIVSRGKIV